MKSKIYLLFILTIFVSSVAFSQKKVTAQADTGFFNYAYWNAFADKKHYSAAEKAELIANQKAGYLEEIKHVHTQDKDLVWVTEEAISVSKSGKGYNAATTNAGPCTNIDFESGSFAGWTRSKGFNPNFNVAGCCATMNAGDQTIVSGAGNDPYGGFPMVYPGGGSFSLRLGSTATGGIADRMSQTFFVTAANANFTYRYAAVLNDGGHATADQPRFTSEIIDSLGNQISCTFYQVSAGNGITGYSTSPQGAPGNNSPVIYKSWTNVAVDLTPNIGQNVTLRFTVYDCGPGGHFSYAYLDGVCTNFQTSVSDTICPNIPVAICAPAGFSLTTWNGPGVVNNPNQCIVAVIPGVYTCTTLLVPGCPGPTFHHTLVALPAPILTFTAGNASACAPTYSFISTKTITSGYIQSFYWDFGDGTPISNAPNPVHVYANSGTYAVKLRAVSNRGCADSVISFVTIFPNPNLSFSPPSNCINSLVQFTNSSTIPLGSIVGYTWSLGTGLTSNSVNPTETYTANGTYTITLTGQSNQGCLATLIQTLGIFPPPVVSFTANPLCDKNGTAFTPSVSAAVSAGSLAIFNWNFGDGQTSTQSNPVHIYNAPGIYTVTFNSVSDHNCLASISNTFLISPSPTVAFATTSVNACERTFTFTNNSAILSGPINYTWSFGGTNTTTATNPTYIFPTIGNYTVKLIGVSNMGCGDTVTQKISVYPYPTLNLSVPASCESAIFSASGSASSGTITSYAWDFGDASSGAANTSTLQNPTHFYSTTNTYTLTLNVLSNLNCPSSQSIQITVYPNPVATFSYSTLNNCSLPYAYVNTSTVSNIGGSTIAFSNWQFGSTTNTSNVYAPGTVNFPGNGTYTVSLITITNHNCSDTASFTILVHPFPALTFSVNPGCLNTPITINSTNSISPIPSAAASISSYTWSLGDGTFSNTPSISPHNYVNPGIYNILYGAMSNMGCSSTVTHTVEIYPAATSDFTVSGASCFNSATQFISSPTVVSTSTVFATNWDFGDGGLGSNPVTTHSYAAPGTYNVTYSVITNNECLTLVTKTVAVYPVPSITSTATGGCLNTPSQLNSTATITLGSITSYSWDYGDGSNGQGQNLNHPYALSGTYFPTVTAISSQNCLATSVNTLIINPLPVINFSPPGACEGVAVQFTNTSSIILGTINSYTWNFGNGNTSNAINPSQNYSVANTYSVTLGATSNLGCTNTTTNIVTIRPLPNVSSTHGGNGCVNDLITLSGNVLITGGSIPSYTLDFGDGKDSVFVNATQSYSFTHQYTAFNNTTTPRYIIHATAISNYGCISTRNDTIIIYPKPFVSWIASKFCYGDSTAFLNASYIPTTGVIPQTIDQHLWNFNDNSAFPTSTLSNPRHLFIGSGNSYTVYGVSLTEISHPEGTLSPVTCSLSLTKTVTIFPVPVPNFVTNTVCLGNPTQFANLTPTLNIAGWSWYQYNNGVLSGLAQNPSFTYSAANVYTAALIALNSFGCRDTFYNTVKIYANPTASFSTNNNCLGQQSIFLNGTSYLDGGPGSHLWTTGTNTIGTNLDATYPFATAGTYTVSLKETSDLGCQSIFTNTVTVYPLPLINFNISQTCIGQTTQFNNSTSGNISSYSWNFGDPVSGSNNTSSLTNPSHQYLSAGGYPTTLTATTDKNCSANFAANVIVHNTPNANFTNTTICATEKLSFKDLSTTQDGNIVKYEWDFNGDNSTDQTTITPSYVYSVSGTYQIRLTVTSEFGCVDDTVRQVSVNPKAYAAIFSDLKSGCPTLCSNFKNLSTIATGSFSTTWEFSDGNASTIFANPTRCFPTSGNYDVNLTLVSDMGCTTKQSYPSYISVYPLPVAGFKVEPEQIDEDEPIITISNQASADANTIKYYVSDGSSFGTPNFTHYIKNLKQTKPLVVQIAKNQYGCVDTIMQVLDIKPSYVVYFPDVFTPNGDGTNDDFRPKGVGITKFILQIYDRWGHQIFRSNDITDVWDGKSKSDDSIKEDTYTWKAQVTDIFNKNHFLVGHVTVIR